MASGTDVLARPPITMSMGEVTLLAQRLDQRAHIEATASLKNDMRLAALALRAMQKSYHQSDWISLVDPKLA